VPFLRRTYRGDGAGAASTVPLDDECGMRGRYMTPDVEEMAAFASAMLTARETEQLLAKTLPEGPSATAIQNAVRIQTHTHGIDRFPSEIRGGCSALPAGPLGP
jgi:hypothetical protein